MTAAHVLGEMGKSVVLIDLDLKRGMDKLSPGLEACLFGHCPVQEVLHRRGAEPYRYAACSRGLSPREVLAVGENLRGAIASLREDADCVLLIAPESARFAEILPAAESCDAAVYVIEQDRASRTKIKAGIEKLLSCDVTVAGCVLNGVQAGLSGYGDGKYGYGYGYGKYGRYGHYGYGHYGAHRTREETV